MPEDRREMLAWRLRKYREQAGITQEEAAKALGLDTTAITKMESNKRGVSAKDLFCLAKLYNVEPGILLGEEEQSVQRESTEMKRFVLSRTLDPVGISGTGKIAEGVMFTNGKVVLQWLTQYQSIGIYDCVSDVLSIHGHNGTTSVVFIDDDD
jgi:transcriptional regulator with XRE-family HTH domain